MLAKLPESHRNFAIQLSDYMWVYSGALESWYVRRRKNHEEGKPTPGKRHLVRKFLYSCHLRFGRDVDFWMMDFVLELHGLPYRVRLTSGGHLVYNSIFYVPDTDDGILWSSCD